ncbi:MAG: group I intron-associated PD-(D/E)XK endonuclease [Nitrospiraceae bacterium]
MSAKLKGDITEQAAILHALKRGWGVLKPIGDRLSYDLVFDVHSTLVKVQVKTAWFDESRGNYVVDNRRTKTNRRVLVREVYTPSDFDFALAYLPDRDLFYVFPVEVFISYASEIHLVEADKRQRKPRSAAFRDAWKLIQQWAAHGETYVRQPVKFGEAVGGVTPSQALRAVKPTEKV